MMDSGEDLFVNRQISSIQASCSSAANVISGATSIAEVARRAQVVVPSYLRHAVQRDIYQLQQAGERRAQTLLKAQFTELEALQGGELAQRLQHFRTREWSFLGGAFPRLAQEANREGVRFHQRSRHLRLVGPDFLPPASNSLED